jgi:hypothetical protein
MKKCLSPICKQYPKISDLNLFLVLNVSKCIENEIEISNLHKYLQPWSQYFVEAHLAVITAVSHSG